MEENTTMNETVEQPTENVPHNFPFGANKEVFQQFEYADAYMWCGKCGTDFRAGGNLVNIEQPGLQLPMLSTHSHGIFALACPLCGNKFAIHFKDALYPPVKETEEKPEASEEVVGETIETPADSVVETQE